MTGAADLPVAVAESVAAEAAADAGADAELLAGFLPALATAAHTAKPLTRAQLQRYRACGQDAARRGVALRALLDLYLSAAWRLWRQLPVATSPGTAEAGRVVVAAEAVLRSIDDVVGALSEGHQLARRSLVREQESARREFIDDLLAGQGDMAELADRAHGFGLDLAGPHAAAVVRAEAPFADGTPLTAQVERAVLGSRGDADVLVTSKRGRLVVLFAAPDAAAIEEVSRQLGTALRPKASRASVQLTRTADVGPWQLAIGRPHQGPAGVPLSYEDAQEALDLAGRLGMEQQVVLADDLLVYRMLLRDRAAITDLVEVVLGPLASARGGVGPLLDTLSAYFDSGGNSAETARMMHLSVRAVTYRLQRIHALTAHDPTRSVDRFTLHAAVLGARLLGWPPRLPETGKKDPNTRPD